MLKKLLALTLVFVGIFTLAACGPDTPEMTDLEKLQEATDGLELPAITGDQITLPATGLHGVTITWSSSNTDVITDEGAITKPAYLQPDATVTLTATLSLNGTDFTKEFDVTVEAKTETEETDLEKANRLIVSLIFPAYEVVTDITLVDTHQGYAVTWATSNDMYIAADGTVTRPASGEADAVVTLTATYVVGEATITKDFTFTVTAEDPATVYTTVMDLYTNAAYQEFVEFTGVVTAIMDKGYFISDGTYNLSVYKNVEITGIALGDEVTVRGTYTNYNTLYQIGNVVYENVNSSGNAVPLVDSPEVKTIAEILAFDSSIKEIHGAFFEITGTVVIQGSYNNVYLVDGDDEILISYYGDVPSLEALEAEVGKEVTITVFYYTEHGTNGHIVAFYGGAEDITVNTLPDADALAADIDALDSEVPGITVGTIMLPAVGVNGTTFTNWMSDNTAVLDNDGTFVALGAETVVVTFTATATKGDLTETVTVEVVVPVLSTVAEVNEMEQGSYFQVSGTVYEISYYGFFIEENGAYIFVYGSDYTDDVVVGDNITLLGELGAYSGLLQVNPMSDITVNSQGNADVVAAVPTTVSGALNDLVARGTRATITGMVTIEGSYNNAYITDPAGGKVVVYYRSNQDDVKAQVGNIITLTVVTYQNGTVLFQETAADIVVETGYTDAYKAQAAADYLMLDYMVEMDLTLPVENVDAGATIAWASDNEAVIATDGTVNRVAGSDTMVTLTATVTVGTEVVTRDIMVMVKDANDSQPMTVTEALAETDGANLLVEGVVTGVYVSYGDTEVVIQDPATGAAIYVDFDVTDAMVGDLVIVRGDLETYTSYNNNKRQLDSGNLIEIVSSGNAVTVDAETDPAVIAEAFADMKTYTATLTVNKFDFGYVYFDASFDGVDTGKLLKFDAELYAPWFEQAYAVDDTVLVTFTVMDIHYDDTRIVNVQLPAPTDAQLVATAKAALELPATTTEDLELPTEMYGVTISWSSSNPAIGVDGVVTRPAIGEADATGDLTATLTLNSETDTAVFAVTVTALQPEVTYDFTETFTNLGLSGSSYAAGSFAGDNSITWSYTESRGDFTLTDQAIMLDKDGDGASLTGTITGGIGALSIDYFDAYSGGAEVVIVLNEGLASEVTYTSPYVDFDGSGDVANFEVTGINLTGDVTVSIYSGGSQMVLDNLMWTSYTE